MTGTVTGLFTHKSVPVIFEPPCIMYTSLVTVQYIKVKEKLKFILEQATKAQKSFFNLGTRWG